LIPYHPDAEYPCFPGILRRRGEKVQCNSVSPPNSGPCSTAFAAPSVSGPAAPAGGLDGAPTGWPGEALRAPAGPLRRACAH
jgi:hypothetical protein